MIIMRAGRWREVDPYNHFLEALSGHVSGYMAVVAAVSDMLAIAALLAVGWTVRQKAISFTHLKRTAKWNEGLRLVKTMLTACVLRPRDVLRWGCV